MPILQTNKLSYQFDNGEFLFRGLSLRLKARRVGLVGRNGVGKSILTSILARQRLPSDGSVSLNATTESFSQLPTELIHSDLTLTQFLEVEEILTALKQVESGSSEAQWFDIIGERWQLETELAELLSELGLPINLQMPCRDLSGGQLSRLQLWKLFQSDAELLILDEPSNHLDSSAKQWLIKQMSLFSGHILLISHDRLLLRQMEQIWELNSLGLHQYGGNYDYEAIKKQNQIAIERQMTNVKRDQKKLRIQTQLNREKMEKRASQGNKVRRQGSQPKVLLDAMRDRATSRASSRLKNELNREEMLRQKAFMLQKRQEQLKELKIHLQQGSSQKASLAYALNCVLPYGSGLPVSFTLSPASKVHVQGNNGSGKSTLLKVLLGELQPLAGELTTNGPFYYLDQYFGVLKDGLSLLENMQHLCTGLMETDARTLLAGIGFRKDNAYRFAHQLSCGEKMKLAMLIVSHQPDLPVLLLDDPDNHLDLDSKEILAGALSRFEGAFMLVSHDQDFVEGCGVNETRPCSALPL
ncbi:MAG: ATP-binding cassette domain-containing protein [Endozoicomonas sp.]